MNGFCSVELTRRGLLLFRCCMCSKEAQQKQVDITAPDEIDSPTVPVYINPVRQLPVIQVTVVTTLTD